MPWVGSVFHSVDKDPHWIVFAAGADAEQISAIPIAIVFPTTFVTPFAVVVAVVVLSIPLRHDFSDNAMRALLVTEHTGSVQSLLRPADHGKAAHAAMVVRSVQRKLLPNTKPT